MKKVFFSLAVLCSVALVSCGGKKAAEADSAADSVNVEETVAVAEDSNETVVAEVANVEAAPAAEDSAK